MAQQSDWRQEFKDFVMRGNVIDLAVAVVLGVAFAAIVTAFVNGLIMPLIAAIVGQPSFESLIWTLNDSTILYGSVIQASVNFLLVAAALFFTIRAVARMQKPNEIDITEEESAPAQDVQLLSEIRDLLAQQQRVQ